MDEAISSPIQLYLLGRWELRQGERRLLAAAWTRRKAAGLLQALALGKRLHKDEAIERFWPDYAPSAGANNLYRTLHALRATVDEQFGPDSADRLFTFQEGILALAGDVWVDVDDFRRLAQSDRPDELLQALELYRGELLPDARYDEWSLRPREELAAAWRRASLALAAHRQNQADWQVAMDLLTPL